MIILRRTFLLKAISFLTLMIFIENVYCTCPISVGNVHETLNNTCDWSSWLQWDCSTCHNQSGKASPPVRKRAICCEKGLNVTSCLKSCNYSKGSDTDYGNCSTHCVSYPSMTTKTITTTTIATTTTAAAAATTTTTKAAATTSTTASATTYRRVSTGIILGTVAGCIAGLLIIAVVIIWSRKKFKSPVEPEPEPETIERPPQEDEAI